ncbi:ubiquitin-conjugating enzyme E2 J2, partial [Phenoliferia sp. Uapishka_3]
MSASKQAAKRLQKEHQALEKAPPPFVYARPNESNILEWHYILRGPPDTPYHGGEYYGVILFPSDYPFAPPGLKMNTPSGRFSPGAAICTSMSNFHPGSWNPAWSVQTILTGLLSFMVSDEMTTGSMRATDAERKQMAKESHLWNCAHPRFKLMFPEYATPTILDVPDMGVPPSSSSTPPTTTTNVPPTSSSSSSTTSIPNPESSPIVNDTTEPKAGDEDGLEQDLDGEKVGQKARGWRKEIVWAFLVLLVSWAGMKVWDGPLYGGQIANFFNGIKGQKALATFFVNGNNYDCIYDYADDLKARYAAGHMIASHTWTHARITDITPAQLNEELTLVLKKRGYTVVTWNFDDGDSTGSSTSQSLKDYAPLYKKYPKAYMALNHEVYENVAQDIVPYVVPKLVAAGYKLVTVAQCLGDSHPYQIVGKPGKRDKTWTCEGKFSRLISRVCLYLTSDNLGDEDISANMGALEELQAEFGCEMLFVESGGDNLAAKSTESSRRQGPITPTAVDRGEEAYPSSGPKAKVRRALTTTVEEEDREEKWEESLLEEGWDVDEAEGWLLEEGDRKEGRDDDDAEKWWLENEDREERELLELEEGREGEEAEEWWLDEGVDDFDEHLEAEDVLLEDADATGAGLAKRLLRRRLTGGGRRRENDEGWADEDDRCDEEEDARADEEERWEDDEEPRAGEEEDPTLKGLEWASKRLGDALSVSSVGLEIVGDALEELALALALFDSSIALLLEELTGTDPEAEPEATIEPDLEKYPVTTEELEMVLLDCRVTVLEELAETELE